MWKDCKVVMLPTNEKALIKLGLNNLMVIDNYKNSVISNKNDDFISHHLYIISDDEIKEDDWYIANNTVFKADSKFDESNNPNQHKTNKKIIATTDKFLTINNYSDINRLEDFEYELPQPSQSFIEKFVEEYNKGNIITDVLVEYWAHTEEHPQLKINPKDNTINVQLKKDSWSREEVIDLIRDAVQSESIIERDEQWMGDTLDCVFYNIDEKEFDNWIKENVK